MALTQFHHLSQRSCVIMKRLQLQLQQCRALQNVSYDSYLHHRGNYPFVPREHLLPIVNQSNFQNTVASLHRLTWSSRESANKRQSQKSLKYCRLSGALERPDLQHSGTGHRLFGSGSNIMMGFHYHPRRSLHLQHKLCNFTTSTRNSTGDGGEEPDFTTLGKEIIQAARKMDVMAGSVPLVNVVQLLQDLHALGFHMEQMMRLLSLRVWLLQEPRIATTLAGLLQAHGLKREVVIHILENLPLEKGTSSLQVFQDLINTSLQTLRDLGFTEKDLQSFLMSEPSSLFMDSKNYRVVLGRLKGLFTAADALALIKKCPSILSDTWEEIHDKFNYAFFTMGYQQPAIVKTRLFQHSLEHIQDRHLFLVRAGLFVPVRQKDDPKLNPNPSLKDVVDSPNHVFVKKFGGMNVEDYEVYLSMREIERENEELMSDEAGSEDESDEESLERGSKKKGRKKDKFKGL